MINTCAKASKKNYIYYAVAQLFFKTIHEKKNMEKVRKSCGHHANGHTASVKNQNVAFFPVTCSNLST